jgi:hypothetical protein
LDPDERSISVIIPGAKNPEQARANPGGAALAPLSPDTLARIRSICESSIKPSVHQRWLRLHDDKGPSAFCRISTEQR